MIIYNTTFHIASPAFAECTDYLKREFIPQAVASGFLHTPSLRHVLHTNEEEGESVAVQFYVKNMDTLNYWLEQEGRTLLKRMTDRFGHQVAGFSTLMEEIDWQQ